MHPAFTSAHAPIVVPGPDCLPAVVPHLLGFHPSRSLVLLGIDPGTRRVHVTLRFDLPDPVEDPLRVAEAWASTFGALHQAGGVDTIVLLYPGPEDDPWARPWPHDLPRGALVSALADELTDAGLRPWDAVCVVGGRLRSYWCESDSCCPPEGRPARWSESLAVEAELVGLGSAPLASREALESTLDPLPLDDTFVVGVADALRRRRERVVGSDVDEMNRCLIWLATGAPAGDIDAVADLILVCSRIRTRDLLLRALTVDCTDETRSAARTRLVEAVRAVPDEYVAPVASVLAVCAWMRGEGAAARVAVERALAVDPAYSLAGLLSAALDAGTPPWTWRAMMADLTEGEILAGGRSGSDVDLDLLGRDDDQSLDLSLEALDELAVDLRDVEPDDDDQEDEMLDRDLR